MKHLLVIFAFCSAAILSAQSDTSSVNISQETGTLEKQRFIDRYDYVFGTQEPARWMFKMDAGSLPLAPGLNNPVGERNNTEAGVRVDVEFKISSAFSINTSYNFGFDVPDGNMLLTSDPILTHGLRVEPRWYFNMARRIREGRNANNFSGNYLGLEYVNVHGDDNAPFNRRSYQGANLRFGIQRRLFRYGYFDMSYGLGVRYYPTTIRSRGLTDVFADARLGIGLALTSPRPETKIDANYCDLLRCFREERRMFKIDLYNLVRVVTKNSLKGTARVAVEQKIADSPISIEAQVLLGGEHFLNKYQDQTTVKWQSFNSGLQLQGRYYFDLKRRIARGKSGNNLSGPYVAWQADLQYGKAKFEGYGYPAPGTFKVRTLSTGPLFGIQYRLFEHGFIDFNLGAGWGNTQKTTVTNGETTQNNQPAELTFLGGLRIGLAF